MARALRREDIISVEAYEAERAKRKAEIKRIKAPRRIEVGPFACFYFESFDTMLYQVQEMLHIERGGEEQLADELAAYCPLVPSGDNLVATLMLEIADAKKRYDMLLTLTDIELSAFIAIAGEEEIFAKPEQDVERTSADGKTSSVHFLHFHFSPEQIKAFKASNAKVQIGFRHENYRHIAELGEEQRGALAGDLD